MIIVFDYILIDYSVLLIDYTVIVLKVTFISPIINLNKNELIS